MKFFIIGKPVPLGRPRFRVIGKFATAYTPTTSRKWMESIREQAAAQMLQGKMKMLKGRIRADVVVFPKKLASGKMPKRVGDLDNHVKAALDALNGLAYEDDSQIAYITAEMSTNPSSRYGLLITIAPLEENNHAHQ